ncbi:glycosyltransferase family 2 protein [Clostridium disporicum]|uniref:Family 2 glycosyl transferase n=1 Tax=Clostridium disporicum TaxID=84024 RepID=A0A174EZ84_9CLOT|nr:glycosyltransferase family 2 protein [Clostridium disporicum]CUO42597.1 family 2 glycosyl transferase [Clostridium disporicum]
MNDKLVCCIIVTYNIGNKFNKCYDSIKQQVSKVIIVDNGSNLETVNILNKLIKDKYTDVIFNEENLGIAKALNQGIERAINEEFKWIITMDNDSVATDNMVNTMLQAYESIPDKDKVVSLFPKYIDLGINEEENYNNQNANENVEFLNAEITSGNLIKADIFNKVGLFEEKLFIDMVDYEFCFRISKLGYKLVRVNNAVLQHNLGNMKVKRILGKNIYYTNHNYIRRYYITRNRFYTWNKFDDCNFEELYRDKKFFLKDIIKIILLEEEKNKKIKMIIRGYIDFKKDKYGKFDGNI